MKKINLELGNLKSARMDTTGRALMLEFDPIGDKQVTLELTKEQLPGMVKILFGFAHAAGEFWPPAQNLPDVPLSSVQLIPGEEIDVRHTETGAVWLVFRTGVLCTAMALPDSQLVRALGQALLSHVPK